MGRCGAPAQHRADLDDGSLGELLGRNQLPRVHAEDEQRAQLVNSEHLRGSPHGPIASCASYHAHCISARTNCITGTQVSARSCGLGTQQASLDRQLPCYDGMLLWSQEPPLRLGMGPAFLLHASCKSQRTSGKCPESLRSSLSGSAGADPT